MKWYKKEFLDGTHIYLKLDKETVERLIKQLQSISRKDHELSIMLNKENEIRI